ncbi:hypothetical protein FHR83_007049 [Actinoplanes campanulatus]|uniref:Uncharacterized protein n=1 Tax=Actinoplanes campanulatus TaxID=113559 RepID=A0A7W5AN82_9ACTN|nr:hypothetical protein [Actinoplanes campanulatus]MBB3099343.1 hypothetical protein [Actinoplanes campanulatus]GGN40387.1 hypothetical protein GCM10010109_69430 [Actinoplanes campanulatus]GID40660.1 hypothetical protein Aca09nite_71660 [Actinoplanes campanulatus]
MPEIPEYLRLTGDEDGDVSLDCHHSGCDTYEHGSIAYYGWNVIRRDKPYFEPTRLAEFIDFINQHAASHGESF